VYLTPLISARQAMVEAAVMVSNPASLQMRLASMMAPRSAFSF